TLQRVTFGRLVRPPVAAARYPTDIGFRIGRLGRLAVGLGCFQGHHRQVDGLLDALRELRGVLRESCSETHRCEPPRATAATMSACCAATLDACLSFWRRETVCSPMGSSQ